MSWQSLSLGLATGGLVLALASPAAQARQGDLPPSLYEPGVLPLSQVQQQEMPPVDVAAAMAFDATVADKLYAPVGLISKARFDPQNHGTWETLSPSGPNGGGEIWRLRVRSANALWVRAAFGTWRIPHGAKMWFYDPALARIDGPYTSEHVRPHGQRWSNALTGEVAVCELYWPPELSSVAPNIHMTRFSHGYSWGDGPLGGCDPACDPDVTCPVGADISVVNRGVVRLYVPIQICPPCDGSVSDCDAQCNNGGTCTLDREAMCTGSLVNNTAKDCRQLVLTAAHCVGNGGLVPGTRFLFNYQSSACCLDDADDQDQLTGATFLMMWKGLPNGAAQENDCIIGPVTPGSDVALMEIDDEIPASFNARLNGWTRADNGTGGGVCIHQYAGATSKKVATTTDGFQDHPTDNKFWRVPDWEQGLTKGGSSGAPLFNSALRTTGVLSTGPAPGPCTGTNDNFGKLSAAWNPNNNNGNRLKPWLDPASTGTQSIPGRDHEPEDDCGAPPWGSIFKVATGPPSHANGDHTPISITLRNPGEEPLTDVFGILTTTTQGVTVAQSTATWPDIPPGGTAESHDLMILIGPTVACGAEIECELEILSTAGDRRWEPSFTIRKGAPIVATFVILATTQTSLEGSNAWQLDPTGDDTPATPRWFIADVASRSDTVLVTDPMVVAPDSRLLFRHRHDTENTYDGGVLEFSRAGSAWEDASALVQEGGYLSGLSANVAPGIRGRNAWSGDSDGWQDVALDLSPLAGQAVQFRWRFATDDSEGDVGWWIDDAVIETTTFKCEPDLARPALRRDSGTPGQASPPQGG